MCVERPLILLIIYQVNIWISSIVAVACRSPECWSGTQVHNIMMSVTNNNIRDHVKRILYTLIQRS